MMSMAEKIQTIYILILNAIYCITGKIDKKVRNIIIWIFSFLLIVLCVYNYTIWSKGARIPLFERSIMGCFFLSGIAVFSVDGRLKKISWNRQFVFIWYVLAILLFISGLLHSVEDRYWLWSFSMLLGFPGFYLIWQNRRDYDTIFKLISSAMLVVLFIFFIICLYTINSEMNIAGRYEGPMKNPNHLGMLAVSGALAALYLCFTSKHMWIYGIPLGICWKLSKLSGSRTAMIIFITQVIVLFVFYIKHMSKPRKYKKIAGNLLLFLCIGIMSSCFTQKGLEYFLEQHDKALIEMAQKEENNRMENDIESTKIVQEQTSENSTPPVEIPQSSIDDNETFLKERIQIKGRTSDQISSGRIAIWKCYIKRFNLLGNDWKNKKSGTPESYYQWAHNDIIEISYRSGIFAGFFYFLFLAYLGIYLLNHVCFKKKIEPYDCFVCLAIVTYGSYAMFEVISYPFGMQYRFMLFASLMPVFERRNELWTK